MVHIIFLYPLNPSRLFIRPDALILPLMADESFKEFVADQLGALPDLRVRAMFGGFGLYQADRFFAILIEGRLYFKTDRQNRAAYVERGMKPFIYEKAMRTVSVKYFEVPPEILEDRQELVIWAGRAIQAATTLPPKRKKK